MNKITPEFESNALCSTIGLDPEIWFDYEVHRGGSVTYNESTKLAREVCYSCPALRECRAYAMQFFNLHGIWGGLDHVERGRMQKALGQTPTDFTSTYTSPIQPLRGERQDTITNE
jgi:WhiB family redox-sensing transcriptional regulator